MQCSANVEKLDSKSAAQNGHSPTATTGSLGGTSYRHTLRAIAVSFKYFEPHKLLKEMVDPGIAGRLRRNAVINNSYGEHISSQVRIQPGSATSLKADICRRLFRRGIMPVGSIRGARLSCGSTCCGHIQGLEVDGDGQYKETNRPPLFVPGHRI